MNEKQYRKHAVAWSGTCDSCLTNYVVYPHPEADKDDAKEFAEGPDEWSGFTTCWVCDDSISWNGSDPVSAVIRHA